MRGLIAPQHVRQEKAAERQTCADAERSRRLQLPRAPLEPVERVDDVQRRGVELVGCGGAVEPVVHALKKAQAVAALQLRDRAADRRLRQVERLGGLRDALQLIYAHKNAQVTDGHGALQHIKFGMEPIRL